MKVQVEPLENLEEVGNCPGFAFCPPLGLFFGSPVVKVVINRFSDVRFLVAVGVFVPVDDAEFRVENHNAGFSVAGHQAHHMVRGEFGESIALVDHSARVQIGVGRETRKEIVPTGEGAISDSVDTIFCATFVADAGEVCEE